MDKEYMNKLVDMFKKGKIIVDENGNLALSESYLKKTRKIKGVKKEEKSKTYSKEGIKLSEKIYLAQLKSGELKLRGGRKSAQKFNEELKVKMNSKRIGEERREVYRVLSGMIDRYVEGLVEKSSRKASKQKAQEEKANEELTKQKIQEEKMMEVSRRSGVDFETVKAVTLDIMDRMKKTSGQITFEEAIADLIYEKNVAFNEAKGEEEKGKISSEITEIKKTISETNVDLSKIEELVEEKEIRETFFKRDDMTEIEEERKEPEVKEKRKKEKDIVNKIFSEIPHSHEEKIKYFQKYYDMLDKRQKYELKLLYLENRGLISRIRARMPWSRLDRKVLEQMEFRYDMKYTLAKYVEECQRDDDTHSVKTKGKQEIAEKYKKLKAKDRYELRLSRFRLENNSDANIFEKIALHFPNRKRDEKVIRDIYHKHYEADKVFEDIIFMEEEKQKSKEFAKEGRRKFLKRVDVRGKVSGSVSPASLHKKAKTVAIGSQEK